MKKYQLGALLGICAMFTGACEKNENTDISTEQIQQNLEVGNIRCEDDGRTCENLLQEYYALLITTENVEDVYRFLESHISHAGEKDADQLVNGLTGYLADIDKVDYIRLLRQKEYLSKEMWEYLELMKREQEKPAIREGRIEVALEELLLRAKDFEFHAGKYPEGVTFSYAYEKYSELLDGAVTGFYDGESDWSNNYLDIDMVHIEKEAVRIYRKFMEEYPHTNTAAILQEYVNLLEKNKYIFTKQIKFFYERMDMVIKRNFRLP